MKPRSSHRILSLLVLAGALLTAACTNSSPSEPKQTPGPPVGGVPGSATYNITVTPNPPELPAGSTTPVTITVQVRRADNGQAPPNGTTIVVTTSLGTFSGVGGSTSLAVELLSGQAQLLLFAPSTEGTATVQARLETSLGIANVLFRGLSTFFISFLSPNVGTPAGGDSVVVNGGGFEEPVRVTFNGVAAQVQSISTNQIRVITPPAPSSVPVGSTLPVSISVTVRLNTTTQDIDTLPGGFIYAQGGGPINQPQVFSVTPASGPNEGGTVVTINGDGFEAPVQVFFGTGASSTTFNGIEASVRTVTQTQIIAVVPSATGFGQDNRNQRVGVLVKNINSGFATIAQNAFKYGVQVLVTSIGPGAGSYRGGDLVTIFGQGFDEPVAVSFGGVAQSVISVTGTEIIVRTTAVRVEDCSVVSPGVNNGVATPIRVVNIETGDSFDAQIGYEYLIPKPVITGIAPNNGGENGGTVVTVSGQQFETPVRVVFGDQAGSVTGATASSVTTQTPRFTGTFMTQACQTGGGEPGERFIPSSVDVELINLTTGCTDTFTNGFTYNPNDNSCRTTTPVGNPPAADFTFTNVGLQVSFTDTSLNTPTTWMWNFGDTTTSNVRNPTHTYLAPGNYMVMLTVSNAFGSSSVTQNVTVP